MGRLASLHCGWLWLAVTLVPFLVGLSIGIWTSPRADSGHPAPVLVSTPLLDKQANDPPPKPQPSPPTEAAREKANPSSAARSEGRVRRKQPTSTVPKRTRPAFFTEPHKKLKNMSVVHFLVWDLEEKKKVTRELTVVVHRNLAPQVLEIFKGIYHDKERFPIHEVIGYNYRTVLGGKGLSKHALGRAIDINRAENPMYQGGKKLVHPDEPPYQPQEWRPGKDLYSISREGSVVRLFKARGWQWGGDWHSSKDYQHFVKP